MIRALPPVIDLALVVVFAILGRASHAEALSLGGIATTLWPFAVGCVFAWVIIGLLGDSGLGLRAAAIIWLVTWLGGLGLRVTFGGTAAVAFIIVAGSFLLLSLGGWRLIFWLVRRRRTS
ncbi:MAG: DUF3054 domain-containing protein [Arachnia sp.]